MVIFHSFFYVYQRVWKPGSARKCLVSGSTGAVGVKLLVPAGQSRAFPRGKVRDRSPYPDCHPRRRAEASTVGSKGSPMDQSKKSLVGTGDGAWFTNKKHQQDPTGKIRFFTNFNISLRIRPWLAPEMASYFCCLQWLAGRNHCHWKTWFDMVWFFFLGELPTKPKRRTTQSSLGWFPRSCCGSLQAHFEQLKDHLGKKWPGRWEEIWIQPWDHGLLSQEILQ